MRFYRADIQNFGRLRSRQIDFQPGLNIIYGKNESGKSTLHMFLRAMLYGMERKRGRAAQSDDWNRYEPYTQNGSYGGRLIFQCGERSFQVERTFDRSYKEERLLCLDDGEELSLEQGDMEMLLCQMTEKGYRNSVSLEQNAGLSREMLAEEIRNQAVNYSGSASDAIDVSAVLKELKDKRKDAEKKLKEMEEEQNLQRYSLERKYEYLRNEKDKKVAALEQIKNTQEDLEIPSARRNIVFLILAAIVSAAAFYYIKTPWNFFVAGFAFLLEEIWYILNKKSIEADKRAVEAEWLEEHGQSFRKQVLVEDVRELNTQIINVQTEISECMIGGEKYAYWKRKIQVYKEAEQRITNMTSELQSEANHSGRLAERMSDIFGEITDGEYERVFLDDEMNCSVYAYNRKIPARQLSKGTLDQLMFALRMAAAERLYEEPMPVVLDDAFVCYDEDRLEAMMIWLYENRDQVLLFTCRKQEIAILDKYHIPYNLIEM